MYAAASTSRLAKTWLGSTRRVGEQPQVDHDDEAPRPMEMRQPSGPGTNPWHSPGSFDRNTLANGQPPMQSQRRASTSQTMAALAARDQQERSIAAQRGLGEIPDVGIDTPPPARTRRDPRSRYPDSRAGPSTSPSRNPYIPSSTTSSRERSSRPRHGPRSDSPYSNSSDQDDDLSGLEAVQPTDFTSHQQSGRYYQTNIAPPPMQDGQAFQQGPAPENDIDASFVAWWKELQQGLASLQEMKARLANPRDLAYDDRYHLVCDMKTLCDKLSTTVRQFRSLIKTNITREKLAEIAEKYNIVDAGRSSKLLHDIEGLRRQIQKITTEVDRDFRAMQTAQLKKTSEENERAASILAKSDQDKKAIMAELDANPEGFISRRVMNGERLGAANMTLDHAQQRLRLAQEMEATVELLAQLTSELADKVECQDAQIVQVEQEMEQVGDRVEGGNKHIDEGIVKAVKKRKKKWWCLLAAVLTLLIIGGILAVYFLVIKKRGAGGGGDGGADNQQQQQQQQQTNAATIGGFPAQQQSADVNHVARSIIANLVAKRWEG